MKKDLTDWDVAEALLQIAEYLQKGERTEIYDKYLSHLAAETAKYLKDRVSEKESEDGFKMAYQPTGEVNTVKLGGNLRSIVGDLFKRVSDLEKRVPV
jgi:hypothetical protein